MCLLTILPTGAHESKNHPGEKRGVTKGCMRSRTCVYFEIESSSSLGNRLGHSASNRNGIRSRRAVSSDSLPYQRAYGRILAVSVLICIPIFLAIPEAWDPDFEIRFPIGFCAMSFAALWCPVLAYAGLRTKNSVDVLLGLAGLLSLFFWVPILLLP